MVIVAPEKSQAVDPHVVEFVLQGYDPATDTVCVEWLVRIADIDAVREVFAPDSDRDPDMKCVYRDLSDDERRCFGQLCLPPVVPEAIYTGICRLDRWRANIPYMVHTNFELPLMLEGRKKFAILSECYPSEWFDGHLQPFEPFVESGQLVRRIVDTPMPHLNERRPDLDGIRRVYFALPGEEWRIDKYIEAIDNRTSDWSDGLERLEGSLFGYEDWQCDWWIDRIVRRREGGA
jgi:hypothetical protein